MEQVQRTYDGTSSGLVPLDSPVRGDQKIVPWHIGGLALAVFELWPFKI